MLIGCLALAGFPGLAGFFSKDEILTAAINATEGPGKWLGVLGLLVALMTAYYTFRLYFRVFEGPLVLPENAGGHEASPFEIESGHGDGHGHDAHGHDAHGDHGHGKPSDGSPLLWLPLLILSVGAVFAGYIGWGEEKSWIHNFLEPVFKHGAEGAGPVAEHGVAPGVMMGIEPRPSRSSGY